MARRARRRCCLEARYYSQCCSKAKNWPKSNWQTHDVAWMTWVAQANQHLDRHCVSFPFAFDVLQDAEPISQSFDHLTFPRATTNQLLSNWSRQNTEWYLTYLWYASDETKSRKIKKDAWNDFWILNQLDLISEMLSIDDDFWNKIVILCNVSNFEHWWNIWISNHIYNN